eukprot:6718596-Prymnesium_polylepis.1
MAGSRRRAHCSTSAPSPSSPTGHHAQKTASASWPKRSSAASASQAVGVCSAGSPTTDGRSSVVRHSRPRRTMGAASTPEPPATSSTRVRPHARSRSASESRYSSLKSAHETDCW